ncbi:MAG: PEP-CTERM sorting domain-containing protein [Verrucomicrobiae bacterium]|nr:PEP-CTERM sorting domain-containing protein [Verrucomicrobiae bacterium]NNJ44253.1 PEP-CTERM sorting domain-containing protein [Akkermansiaceae bacterium]
MTVVNNFDGDKFISSYAYLINPIASTGDVVINANENMGARLSNAYAVFSLANVAAVADSDARTSNGSLGYTTPTDGGYVFVAGVNNDYNGPAPTLTATNADLTIFSAAVDGNQSTIFAHGDVATAGTFSETLSGGTALEAGSLVAFEAVVPEPSTTALLGLGGLALILRRRK